jgi:hypothetical protein
MNAITTWPLQADCAVFYGNPTSVVKGVAQANRTWEAKNLVLVPLPWAARASWDKKIAIKSLRVHRLVAESLKRALAAIWVAVGQSQAEIERIGLNLIGGGYVWRLMRGGNSLSMHSYGCAIDLDPERNGLGDQTPAMDPRVIAAFEAEGWTWGGRWKTKDGMHFQAARVSGEPLSAS